MKETSKHLLQFPERVAKNENFKPLNGILSFLDKIREIGNIVTYVEILRIFCT